MFHLGNSRSLLSHPWNIKNLQMETLIVSLRRDREAELYTQKIQWNGLNGYFWDTTQNSIQEKDFWDSNVNSTDPERYKNFKKPSQNSDVLWDEQFVLMIWNNLSPFCHVPFTLSLLDLMWFYLKLRLRHVHTLQELAVKQNDFLSLRFLELNFMG